MNRITNNHLIMRRFVKIALMTLLITSTISLVSCRKNNGAKDQQQDDQNSYVLNFVYSPEADKLTLKIESAEGKKDLNLYFDGDYCWDYHYILLGKDANETCRTGIYVGVLGDFHAIEGEERKVFDNISSFVPLDVRIYHGVADFFETKARTFDINYYFKRTAAQAGIEGLDPSQSGMDLLNEKVPCKVTIKTEGFELIPETVTAEGLAPILAGRVSLIVNGKQEYPVQQ